MVRKMVTSRGYCLIECESLKKATGAPRRAEAGGRGDFFLGSPDDAKRGTSEFASFLN